MKKDNNQVRELNKKDYEFFCDWMGGDDIKTEELRVKAFWQFRDHLINMLLEEIYDKCVNDYDGVGDASLFIEKEIAEPGEPICTLHADIDICDAEEDGFFINIGDVCVEFDYDEVYHTMKPEWDEVTRIHDRAIREIGNNIIKFRYEEN